MIINWYVIAQQAPKIVERLKIQIYIDIGAKGPTLWNKYIKNHYDQFKIIPW